MRRDYGPCGLEGEQGGGHRTTGMSRDSATALLDEAAQNRGYQEHCTGFEGRIVHFICHVAAETRLKKMRFSDFQNDIAPTSVNSLSRLTLVIPSIDI